MSGLILEIKVGGDVVRLQTRPGGVFDSCIGIIPKSKRAEVAQFLVSAAQH